MSSPKKSVDRGQADSDHDQYKEEASVIDDFSDPDYISNYGDDGDTEDVDMTVDESQQLFEKFHDLKLANLQKQDHDIPGFSDFDDDVQNAQIAREKGPRTKNIIVERSNTSSEFGTSQRMDLSPAKLKRKSENLDKVDIDLQKIGSGLRKSVMSGIKKLDLQFKLGYTPSYLGNVNKPPVLRDLEDLPDDYQSSSWNVNRKSSTHDQFGQNESPDFSPSTSSEGKKDNRTQKPDPKSVKKTPARVPITSVRRRTKPTSENTTVFEVDETNTERVNIVYFAEKKSIATAFAEWCKDDEIEKLKAFLMAGKRFSDFVKVNRNEGKLFCICIK